MADRSKRTSPMAYGIDWSNSALTLPERKADEARLLDAMIDLAKAFGASDVEVKEIDEDPGHRGKSVTLVGEGNLDSEGLSRTLRKLVNGAD